MAKQLSVLFVTSEVIPFAKVGGLADISYSFPLAMRDVGHDMRVMLPKYGIVSERKNRIHEINRLRDLPIPIGPNSEPATVKSSSINNPRAKVQAYITTNQKYFDEKKGIYHNPKTGEPYPDNDERFIFFARTVIETCLILGWFPDIIHCNDWQSAMIPAYARTMFPSKFKKTKIVYTIHNFNEQGVYPLSTFAKTGLDKSIQNDFKHKNMFNFLKGGLTYADYITTVSPSYAEELLSDKKHGNGLNPILQENSFRFKGILNGIDTYAWNPKTDILLPKKLSDDVEEFKNENKKALLKSFGLEYKEGTPVIGMVARLDEQKGFSLLIDTAEEFFKEDIKFVLLCDGENEIKTSLKKLSKKFPKKFAIKFEFDEESAHLIEAGSDMFIMPSEFEPCGLNSMYSLAYGSVPIVRATGGLKDIVHNYDKNNKNGNGFVFKNFKAEDFIKTVKTATEAFKNKEQWKEIVKNGMAGDYSWSKSAHQYDEIYRAVMKD